jgi:hypothetical protein
LVGLTLFFFSASTKDFFIRRKMAMMKMMKKKKKVCIDFFGLGYFTLQQLPKKGEQKAKVLFSRFVFGLFLPMDDMIIVLVIIEQSNSVKKNSSGPDIFIRF